MFRAGIAGFVGVLVGAAVIGLGTAKQEADVASVLRAQRFEVRDPRGRLRCVLQAGVGAAAEAQLYDEGGQPRARLWVGADGTPGLLLTHEGGQAAVHLGPLAGRPTLSLHDDAGVLRVILGLDRNGTPSLKLLGADQRQRAVLGGVSLLEARPPRVFDPESSLVLLDANGAVLAELP